MIGYDRGGGGGGFGGFPYRSTHQQGQDGRGGGGRGHGQGRGNRRRRQPPPKSNTTLSAELKIPVNLRGRLVGRGGSTVKWLRETADAKVFVPQQQLGRQQRNQLQQGGDGDHEQPTTTTTTYPVRVNTTELASLLHCLYEISSLLSNGNAPISCLVKMKTFERPSNSQAAVQIDIHGELLFPTLSDVGDGTSLDDNNVSIHLLFRGTIGSASQSINVPSTQQLVAYVMETILEEGDIETIVDNVRFVDSSVDACQWFYKEVTARYDASNNQTRNATTSTIRGATVDDTNITGVDQTARRLVFVFGSESDHPELICRAVKEATT
jgi:hypothetical protein